MVTEVLEKSAKSQSLMIIDEHTDLKKKLIEACKQTQKKVVDSAKDAMSDTQQALNEYGPNKDRYDSFRDQIIGRRDMFTGQYQKALAEYNVLGKIDPKTLNECAEFGAIIITDMCRFFISISAGKVEVDGEQYYAISPNVPLFKAMEGLKKKDEFEFNCQKQHIKELF